MSEAEIALKEAFALFDKDSDSKITAKELGTVMRALGQSPTDAEVQAMLDEIDVDQNGEISFSEFSAMMEKKLDETAEGSEAQEVFKVLDKDGDNFITPFELKSIMINLGEKLTDAEIDAMIQSADTDGDGKISYEEFAKMFA